MINKSKALLGLQGEARVSIQPCPPVIDVVVQSLSCVQLFATPWTAALQASLSFTISGSLLKFISAESVMLSNHLILCHPILLLPSSFPSIRVFSNEFALHRSNRQVWSWSTKRSRAKANRDLPRECTGHSKHPFPTTQEKPLHWTSPDGQHRNLTDYVLCR